MFFAPIRPPVAPTLAPLHCSYSEASYFDGYAFQHIAAYEESKRLARIRTQAIKALDRRTSRR